MSDPAPWFQFMNDVLAGKYESAEDVVRRIIELGGSDPRETAADAPKPAKSTPEERLARIADAHQRGVDVHGRMYGLCVECYQSWPCPTFTWSTEARKPLSPWDPLSDSGAA